VPRPSLRRHVQAEPTDSRVGGQRIRLERRNRKVKRPLHGSSQVVLHRAMTGQRTPRSVGRRMVRQRPRLCVQRVVTAVFGSAVSSYLAAVRTAVPSAQRLVVTRPSRKTAAPQAASRSQAA